MLPSSTTQLLLLLLTTLSPTTAVTVTLTNGINTEVAQICEDLLPGECCRAFQVPFLVWADAFNPSRTTFYSLAPLDIAAVWGAQGNIRGCSGTPIRTRFGPGEWSYEGSADQRAYGASYVQMPTALPPREAEANWLSAEGMVGLVWGGGRWFAKGAALVGEGVSPGVKRLERRGLISGTRGTAYIQAPRRLRRSNVLVVNGTRYVDAGSVELLYENADGRVLNMTG